MDWNEYESLRKAAHRWTGAEKDPANKTVKEIFDSRDKEPLSEEALKQIEEAKERARRSIDEYEVRYYLASFGHFRRWDFSPVNLTREERGEKECWERAVGVSAKQIGILAAGGLTEKKAANRIKRFREAGERMSVLAGMMEDRFQEENTIRRIY